MATGGKATTLLVMVALAVTGIAALSPPKINYCRNRSPSECCRGGRDDDCSVPIRDSLCYCDDFCSGDHPEFGPYNDCCPDYREVCQGETIGRLKETLAAATGTETSVCIRNGVAVPAGTFTDNCNECVCDDGRVTCDDVKLCMVDEKVIEEVNNNPQRYGWTATNYSEFWGRKAMDGLFMRTGTLRPDEKTTGMRPISLSPDLTRIPREFDARWKPEWQGLLSGVRDQGWCGSSWAFSTLDVAQDRHNILRGGPQVTFAPQQLLSCSRLPMEGCNGGYIDIAWNYMRKTGVVDEKCFPYTSGASGKVPQCIPAPPSCKRYRMQPAYRVSKKEEDIQWEIMNDGPVQALMWVNRELFMYRSGVYRCPQVTGEPAGLHSVRILGWGEDDTLHNPPVKYWLVANSWGTGWGEDGLFRIERGRNECGIESFVLAVRGRGDPWAKNGNGM